VIDGKTAIQRIREQADVLKLAEQRIRDQQNAIGEGVAGFLMAETAPVSPQSQGRPQTAEAETESRVAKS
jgi:hypothetical protein